MESLKLPLSDGEASRPTSIVSKINSMKDLVMILVIYRARQSLNETKLKDFEEVIFCVVFYKVFL